MGTTPRRPGGSDPQPGQRRLEPLVGTMLDGREADKIYYNSNSKLDLRSYLFIGLIKLRTGP